MTNSLEFDPPAWAVVSKIGCLVRKVMSGV